MPRTTNTSSLATPQARGLRDAEPTQAVPRRIPLHRGIGAHFSVHCVALSVLLAAVLPNSLAAQASEDDSAESVSDAEFEASLQESAQWQRPRLLLVAARRTPRGLLAQISDTLQGVVEVVDDAAFARQARRQGLPPESHEAFEANLAEQNVELAVVVSQGRRRGRSTVVLTYREGEGGFVLLEEEHPLGGNRLTEEIVERIRSEVRLALAALTRPEGSEGAPAAPVLPVQPDSDEPETTPGGVVRVAISAGGGIGARQFLLPTTSGDIRLSTSIFPAARLRLGIDGRSRPDARFSYGAHLTYLSSVGLRTTDSGLGGSRQTPSRAQRIDAGLRFGYRFADPTESAGLSVELGYSLRRFASEAAVTLPDFSLSGPRLALGLRVPLFDGRLAFVLLPEVHFLVAIDEALRDQGIKSFALGVGGEARIAVRLIDALFVELSYRESHALLTSPRGDAEDIERFGALSITYTP